IAAQVAHLIGGKIEQINSIETYRTGHLGRSAGQEAHNRERGRTLAAAGFADKPERRSSCNGEIDAIDRVGRVPALAMKDHLEAFDLHQRPGGAHDCPSAAMASAILASMAVRSMIPHRSRWLGSTRMKCVKRSRLTRSSRSSSASGSW